MLRKLHERAQEERGFTLIELLVVILIIGILAAIAIPSFLGQRSKATDSQAKVAARTAATAMESYYTDEQTYATATVADLQTIEPVLNDDPVPTIPVRTANSYTVSAVSSSATAVTFNVNRASTGRVTRTCTPTGTGGCPADGTW